MLMLKGLVIYHLHSGKSYNPMELHTLDMIRIYQHTVPRLSVSMQ
jgi:hypothetical protein